MISSQNFLKHVCLGQPTKYTKETHIPLLFNTLKEGKDIASFCSEALITKPTFYNWVSKYKEFQFAYQLALTFSEEKWAQYPENNPDFNSPYWSIIMRNRFGFGKSKFKLADKKLPLEMIEAAQKALDAGEVTATEGTQIANMAKAKAEVKLSESVSEQQLFKETNWTELDAEIKAADRVITRLRKEEKQKVRATKIKKKIKITKQAKNGSK